MLKPIRCEEEPSPPVPLSHPHPIQLERFMRGELSRAEARPVVRHLLSRCPACLPVTRRLWFLGGAGR